MTRLGEHYDFAIPVPPTFLRNIPGTSLLGSSVAMARAEYDVTAFSDAGALALGLPVPEGLFQAAQRRRAEYTAGRYCARAAMSRFRDATGQPFPVPGPSEDAPAWPMGLVGSISHARGQATAVVAPSDKVLSLGVDIERIMTPELTRDIEVYVCPSERQNLPTSLRYRALYVTAIFSAKESLLKCLYPLVGQRFWFDAATVMLLRDMSGKPREFRAYLTHDIPPFRKGWSARGLIRCDNGFVLSAMALKQADLEKAND
ncbi:4'-phosphopantetheinyl transferase family protein [Palleronia caenipelagi]|uniref:Enterobactin synthase component D n=1 Tax=Palleronia caenipelagi TaxID=2489174 RepID=A0A547PUJ5_9RHOB|nr:4'-phosphopantetheinyl transferase superfamily protein [Palleronia caenipelagi]TRD17807.1 4'-phosphopantetheinyl transferase superfamily protein [Palleronia caenipelagi]